MEPTPPTYFDIEPSQLRPRGGTAPALSDTVLAAIRATGVAISMDPADLAAHSRDWWPIAIGWAAGGQVPALPGVVLRPSSVGEVAAVLKVCHELQLPVTPTAGRSGVNGGTVPVPGGVSLDLTALNSIIEVDTISGLIHVEAGMFGPDLEAALNATAPGFTIGHFPQSFDLSTVGGWLACRGAGQYSTRYGKIEDLVVGLTVVLADGTTITTEGHSPRNATGPNLTQLFVGSEGTLGVITSAWLRIHRKPATDARRAFGFSSFDAGLEACREILQRGATPAVLRLYDDIESQRNFDTSSNVLIVLDEADPVMLAATMDVVDQCCGDASVFDVGLVEQWMSHRNNVSQLEPLWRNHVVVDTIETAGPWAALPSLCAAVLSALRSTPGTIQASVHQSHAYIDGACVYFTFAGRPTPDDGDGDVLDAEAAYYRRAWDAVNAALVDHGCTLSHHHGVGLNRARAMPAALGAAFGVLQTLKAALDAQGIMNPGKLGLGDSGVVLP